MSCDYEKMVDAIEQEQLETDREKLRKEKIEFKFDSKMLDKLHNKYLDMYFDEFKTDKPTDIYLIRNVFDFIKQELYKG